MRIPKKQITDALAAEDDLSPTALATALRNIELILDAVALDLDNDFESAALGDASNLIQVMREGLNA